MTNGGGKGKPHRSGAGFAFKMKSLGEALRDARRKKSRLRVVVKGNSGLRRGIYVVRGRVARHWMSNLPAHIAVTKAGRAGRLGTRVAAAFVALLALPVVWNGAGSRHGATVLICTRSGDTLLLNPALSSVERTSRDASFTAAYSDLRLSLSTYLPSPSFEVSPDGRCLTEEYIDGTPVASLPLLGRVYAVRAMIERFVEVASALGHDDASDDVQNALGRARALGIDSACGPLGESTGTLAAVASGALVPSHGDASTSNMVVRNDQVHLIDWDPSLLGTRPFWADPLRPLFVLSDPALARAFFLGEFDDALAHLWSVAGSRDCRLTSDRGMIAYIWCVTFANDLWPSEDRRFRWEFDRRWSFVSRVRSA